MSHHDISVADEDKTLVKCEKSSLFSNHKLLRKNYPCLECYTHTQNSGNTHDYDCSLLLNGSVHTSFLLRFSKAVLGLVVVCFDDTWAGVGGLPKIVGMAPFFRLYDLATNPIDFAKLGLGGIKQSSSK